MKKLLLLIIVFAYPLIAGAVTPIGPPMYCNGNNQNYGGCYILQAVLDVGIKAMETQSECFCESIENNDNCALEVGITYTIVVYQIFPEYCSKNLFLVQGTVTSIPPTSSVTWINTSQTYITTLPEGSCGGGGGGQ